MDGPLTPEEIDRQVGRESREAMPPPAAQAPPFVCRVRLFLLNGQTFDCMTVWPWPLFWHVFKAEGQLMTNIGAVRYEAVSHVLLLPAEAPADGAPDNVVQLRPLT